MNTARVFRLFISSTFSDFVAEREALRQRVFPVLEAYCRERGAAFQAVDLRWGITEDAQRDHDTMRICLEEVRRCQALTPRPNFAVLLGDRYGWEPVPARIPADHWQRLVAAATPAQRRTLRAGYRGPDRNALPPVYHLRPREGDWAQGEAREAALREALRRAADAAGFQGEERLPYFASATHQEIALGALAREDAQGQALRVEDHVSVYLRRIEGLPQTSAAKAFLDWDAAADAPVPGARERLRALASELAARLPDRLRTFTTRWTGQGIDTDHLDDFCARFLQDQQAVIERELRQAATDDDSQVRTRAHADFSRDRARNFRGRSVLRGRIARYLRGAAQAPLIVHGEGGTGKSALMARAFEDAAASGAPGVVMARFIGGVPGTENLHALLTSLTADIARAYGHAEPARAPDIRAARAAWEAALGWPTADRPLVLFLDALDQLERQDGAWSLDWLPATLGLHTRLVASTRGGPVLAAARRRYPRALLQVPAMKPAEGRQMLQAWLQDAREAHFNAGIAPSRGRRLTPRQQQAILQAFAVSGKPLWLKLACEEARNWPSWYGEEDPACLQLPGTVEAMVSTVIGARLIEGGDHPAVFAAHAMGYITAARMGLAEEELAQALATSPEVRREFEAQVARTGQQWQDAGQLPPILWSRLYFDLQPYLTWARVDGALVCRWFHREFKEEVERQLLSTPAQRRALHGHLARTFAQRAPHDAGLWRQTDASGQPQAPALRRVMEQPWQLVRAGELDTARRLLLDFGFCMAKCAANRARDLFLDVAGVCAQMPAGGDLQALETFLRTRLHVLERGDAQWPAHRILLQLATDYGQDNPVTQAARQWMPAGQVDWPRLEKVVYRPEVPPSGVMWVASEHAHRHGLALGASGVCSEGGHLWSWDERHLCHWDPATGQALHVEALPASGRVQPVGPHVLWIARDARTCTLYDPLTGQALWHRRLASPLRDAYPVDEAAIALVDGVQTDVLGVLDGVLRCQIAHAQSRIPRSRWKRMAVQVLAGRWLAYQHVPPMKHDRRPRTCRFSLALYDLRAQRLVYAADISGVVPPWCDRAPGAGEDNPMSLRLAGDQLMLWAGRWQVLDLGMPEAGPRDLDALLRAQVPPAGPQPSGILPTYWNDFVPLVANAHYQVFKFGPQLVAWHPGSGRVLHHAIDPVLHRDRQSIQWGGHNALVVLGHDRHRAVDASKNFRWHLDGDTVEPVQVPALQRPVILASRGELLILSRDHRYDTNQGDYAQPEPLVAHDLRTGASTVFHVMSRVVGYRSMFRHTWLDSGELAVIDGDHLVCLRVDQGVPWPDYTETSFGAMLTVTEDWQHPGRYAIIGNRRWMHIDLSGAAPVLRPVAHPFEWGATGELSGNSLFLWEDDNAMSETGMPGQFGLWRQDEAGDWSLDPQTYMEFLCAEAPDFDLMSSYAATHVGGVFLVGQDGVIHSFGVDSAGNLVLMDSLRGPFNAGTLWIRGATLYVPDAEDEDWMHAATFAQGTFGALTRVPRADLLLAGEVEAVNVRPFRDLALGPLRGSRLFVVGEPVDGWTAWDGAFEGQARDHVCFTGPQGQEARWYGLHDCRILRHRIDYRHLPGRDLFEPHGGEPDVHSLALDDGTYFVCEEDGSAWMVRLVTA